MLVSKPQILNTVCWWRHKRWLRFFFRSNPSNEDGNYANTGTKAVINNKSTKPTIANESNNAKTVSSWTKSSANGLTTVQTTTNVYDAQSASHLPQPTTNYHPTPASNQYLKPTSKPIPNGNSEHGSEPANCSTQSTNTNSTLINNETNQETNQQRS